MKDFLEKIGSNFFVAAFIPALGFLIISSVIFSPIIPSGLNSPQNSTFDPINPSGLLVLTIAVVIGFSLSSLNDFTHRFFQGDYFLKRITYLTRQQHNRAKTMLDGALACKNELFELDARIQTLSDSTDSKDSVQTVESLTEQYSIKESEYYSRLALYKQNFPPLTAIKPTRFGNIIEAADYYCLQQYGIDRTAIWTCLIHVIPNSYYNKVEQSWNSLSFTLNCVVLSFVTWLLCFVSLTYQVFLSWKARSGQVDFLYFVNIDPNLGHIYAQRAWIYLVLSLVALFVMFFFYFASVQVAYQYGAVIRRSVDMFRLELFPQLKMKPPKNSEEEFDAWRKLSEFMQSGKDEGLFEPLVFEYHFEQLKDDQEQKEKPIKVHLSLVNESKHPD